MTSGEGVRARTENEGRLYDRNPQRANGIGGDFRRPTPSRHARAQTVALALRS
jgi:hypothetical protein